MPWQRIHKLYIEKEFKSFWGWRCILIPWGRLVAVSIFPVRINNNNKKKIGLNWTSGENNLLRLQGNEVNSRRAATSQLLLQNIKTWDYLTLITLCFSVLLANTLTLASLDSWYETFIFISSELTVTVLTGAASSWGVMSENSAPNTSMVIHSSEVQASLYGRVSVEGSRFHTRPLRVFLYKTSVLPEPRERVPLLVVLSPKMIR